MNVAIDTISIAERLEETGMSMKTARQVAKEVVHNADQLATKEDFTRLDKKTNFILALVGVTLAVVGTGFAVLGILITAIQ